MSLKRKNVWILGGTGFIGSALVDRLSKNPQYLLHLLVHNNIPYKQLESYNTFTGSLENFDYKWLEKHPPAIIFHLARIAGSNAITRYIASYKGEKANRRLITYLSKMKVPPQIVYVSGSLMYGNQNLGEYADEYSKLSPVAYARYYSREERPWIEAQTKQFLDIRFARPGWIVGPASWFRTFYWIPFILTGKIPMYGDGQQLMSLVHLEDCAAQILNLAEDGSRCQNLNIFSGDPISQQKFAETLAKLLNTSIEPISLKKLQKLYGKTTAEAFNSSIFLSFFMPYSCFGHSIHQSSREPFFSLFPWPAPDSI